MLERIGRLSASHMAEEVLCLYVLHELTKRFDFPQCELKLIVFQACRNMWKMAPCTL